MINDLENKGSEANEQQKFPWKLFGLLATVVFIHLFVLFIFRPEKPWTKKEWREFYRTNPQLTVAVDTV